MPESFTDLQLKWLSEGITVKNAVIMIIEEMTSEYLKFEVIFARSQLPERHLLLKDKHFHEVCERCTQYARGRSKDFGKDFRL